MDNMAKDKPLDDFWTSIMALEKPWSAGKTVYMAPEKPDDGFWTSMMALEKPWSAGKTVYMAPEKPDDCSTNGLVYDFWSYQQKMSYVGKKV